MEVYLEALSEQDFTTIIEWINQKDEDFIVQWAGLTYSYPLTIEQLKAHYSKGINTIESDVFIYRKDQRGKAICWHNTTLQV